MRTLFVLATTAFSLLMAGCADESTQKTSFEPGTQKQYVVYDFWAEWCGPCKVYAPKFEKLQEKYSRSNVIFKRVNIDQDRAAADQFNIHAIPTVVVTADDKEVGRVEGGASESQLIKLLK